MLTFVLGAYAVLGDMRVAAAAAVATAGILAARENIHGWVARITWPELRSALVLLAMTFIVLPVAPDMTVGPSGGVNPREVWLITIVLAAVSFFGYGSVKLLGAERGVLLASLAGGLVSSTAVTMANAKRAATGERAPRLLAAGVSIATAVSFMCVIAIVAVIKPVLLILIGPALLAATVVAAIRAVASVYWHKPGEQEDTPPSADFKNPFSFWPVDGFAIFLAIVIMLGHAIGETFGANGALIGAAGLRLADVDAVTVSLARLVPEPLGARGAGAAILAAVASNTLSKLAIGTLVGRGRSAAEVAGMTAACWASGLAAFWATIASGGG